MDKVTMLVVGNAFDGLEMIGPFADGEEAGDYADVHYKHDTWYTISPQKPNAKWLTEYREE